jgi:putative ABC transport system permease protein
MFKLNFIIALRNIWRNKTSSLINISGLAIGLASCLLLLLYVSYQYDFDSNTKDPENTYKLFLNLRGATGQIDGTIGASTNAMAPILKGKYPGILAASRVDDAGKMLIANGQTTLKKSANFADPDLLKVFSYTFIAGNPKTALASPNNVILTESTARLLFGGVDVLNKSIKFDNKVNLNISAIIKDLPGNTSVNFDFLMPWSLNEALNNWIKEPSWGNFNYLTVVRLEPKTNLKLFNRSIKGMAKEHRPSSNAELMLFPLKALQLHDTFKNGESVGGSKIEQVHLFTGLAIGILMIACINFMNMATAKSEKRAKEVGIKKTIGASRAGLIGQFLMESMLLTFLSTILAIVLIELCIPLFNNLLAIKLQIDYSNRSVWISLLFTAVLSGLLSGSYPAFYLSSFNPIQILSKAKFKTGVFSFSLRQVLVVGQFTFAVILMIATAVIYQQLQFIKNRPAGYQIHELVELQQDGELYSKLETLRERLVHAGAIVALSQTSGTMSKQNSWFSGMDWKGASEKDRNTNFAQLATTYDFVKTTGVKLIAGRDFSKQFASDTAGLLLSKSTIKYMGFTDPIGEQVLFHGEKRTIVGVFEDFILGSPAAMEAPLVVAFMPGWGGKITMRLNTSHPAVDNLATINRIVKEINPAYPVELTFVDLLYAEKLQTEKVLGILSNVFGGLAIFISCLGLFGLAAYSAEQRTKEIGVRKVLGASIASLMQLLSLGFLKMVVVAIVIAIPIATYIMNKWLISFEFHTAISWLMIILAAIATIAIAMLTVSTQTYKAAKANPVDALKYE